MTQDKVISLKISLIKWVIADLNQVKPVKEQRVDGSSKSRNLDFVRCTLVAGKPVLGRKIPDKVKSLICNRVCRCRGVFYVRVIY